MSMKDLIQAMATALVDDESAVTVREVQGQETIVFELCVAKVDLGKIIGKQGKNAMAMRTILIGYAAKVRKRVLLEIIE